MRMCAHDNDSKARHSEAFWACSSGLGSSELESRRSVHRHTPKMSSHGYPPPGEYKNLRFCAARNTDASLFIPRRPKTFTFHAANLGDIRGSTEKRLFIHLQSSFGCFLAGRGKCRDEKEKRFLLLRICKNERKITKVNEKLREKRNKTKVRKKRGIFCLQESPHVAQKYQNKSK